MHPALALILTIAVVVALGWGLIALGRCLPWFERGPRPGEPTFNMGWRLCRLYAKSLHRLEIRGHEHLGDAASREGGLIVVSNHTAGLDPVAIQAAAPFEIRWMMAEDMRLPALEAFWTWLRIIFISRETEQDEQAENGRSNERAEAVREAIRHVQSGGVLGLFPEGGIERPEKTLLPFMPGLGMIVARTRAPVLPVVIENTPQVDPAWASLWRPSRTRITFHPVIAHEQWRSKGRNIATELRDRYHAWTGWPTTEKAAEVIPGKGPGKSLDKTS